MLAVEQRLLRNLETIFDSNLVLGLDEDVLDALASEPPYVTSDRALTIDKLATLREVLKICNRHASYSGTCMSRVTFAPLGRGGHAIFDPPTDSMHSERIHHYGD